MKKIISHTKIISVMILALLFSVMPVECINASENKTRKFDFEESFNYLYINNAEQEEGEEQSIVLSFDNNMSHFQELELLVKDEMGTVSTVQMTRSADGIFLFQNIFETGVYHIEGIRTVVNENEKIYTMEELGVNAYFGVGTEYSDAEKSEHIEVESAEVPETEIKTQVVSIDEEGAATAKASVGEAIEDAESNISGKAKSIQNGVVVVLDPGHDSTHSGASGNGVNEHVATLKIAKYCKEELETYGGVTVYMTRTTAECPFPDSEDNIDDIKQRVKWASEKGADVYVSIHLNASESTSAKGAEVYYHSESTEGKKISQKVQDELVEIGLYDRAIKSNDNYAVTKTAQSYGFPGIIIEHAFLSNSSDAENYLTSNAGLKELGVADATGIADYYDLPEIGAKTTMAEAVYILKNSSDDTSVLSIFEEKVNIEEPEAGEDDESETEDIPGLEEVPETSDGEIIENETTEFVDKIEIVKMGQHEQLASQRFELISAGNKYYYIVAEHSGKVIGISEGKVKQEELQEGLSTQKWAFLSAGKGQYYLCSESGKYLAYSEGEVFVEDVNNDSTQRWTIERASYRSIEGLTPRLVSAKCSDENVVIKWKELTGADGYYVYRKTEDTKWKRIGNVESETTVSYKDTSAPSKTKCTYTVKAYKGDTVSLYDKKGLTITTPEKKTYIKYKTTEKVNYRTGPGTSYSKAGTLERGTVVSVENGYSKKADGYTWYRFKLDSNEYYIAADYLTKETTLSKPVLVSAKYNDTKVTVKWEKVTDAKGYYVYRKMSGESWSKIATVKSGATISYKDKSVSAGNTYIYTVRAYSGSTKSSYDKTGISVKIPAKETFIKYKINTKVNYRSGAGMKYEIKGTLEKGNVVNVVKGSSKIVDDLKWYKIKISGKYYYVAAKYLKKVS